MPELASHAAQGFGAGHDRRDDDGRRPGGSLVQGGPRLRAIMWPGIVVFDTHPHQYPSKNGSTKVPKAVKICPSGSQPLLIHLLMDSGAGEGPKPRFLTKMVVIGGLSYWGSL